MATTPRFTYLKMQVAFLSGSACVGRSDGADEVPCLKFCPFNHLRGAKMEIAEDPMIGGSNLNEKTALVYGDSCLLTADRNIMADVNRIFNYLEQPKTRMQLLFDCNTLLVCPTSMRSQLTQLINREIKAAKDKKPASIILKLNSLSDEQLINKLTEAAKADPDAQPLTAQQLKAMVPLRSLRSTMTEGAMSTPSGQVG